MAITVTPTLPVIATTPGAAAPGFVLQSGTLVNATVLNTLAENLVRIAIAGLSIDVLSEVPLQAGQTLRLAVSQTDSGIRLAIVPGGSQAPIGASFDPVTTPTGQVKILSLTDRAREHLEKAGITLARKHGGPEHEYWKFIIADRLRKRGFTVTEEYAVGGGKTIDLHAARGEEQQLVPEGPDPLTAFCAELVDRALVPVARHVTTLDGGAIPRFRGAKWSAMFRPTIPTGGTSSGRPGSAVRRTRRRRTAP